MSTEYQKPSYEHLHRSCTRAYDFINGAYGTRTENEKKLLTELQTLLYTKRTEPAEPPNPQSYHEKLVEFFHTVAELTSNHDSIGDHAVVFPSHLENALRKVDPGWWKDIPPSTREPIHIDPSPWEKE